MVSFALGLVNLDSKIKFIQSQWKCPNPPQSELPLNEKEELEQLRKENRVLKSRLKREELGHQAYKLLVELAEETYGIQIRKNSEAK